MNRASLKIGKPCVEQRPAPQSARRPTLGHARGRERAGWTLPELLIVAAVVALLLVLSVPAFNRVRAQSRNVGCLSNLRQIGMAFLRYQQDSGGLIPPGGRGKLAWNVQLKPYGIIIHDPSPLLCPADPAADNSFATAGYSYSMNIDLKSSKQSIIFDGTLDWTPIRANAVTFPAKTILMGDSETKVAGRWLRYEAFFGERHGGHVNFVFCDGHAESLTKEETKDPVDLWSYHKTR